MNKPKLILLNGNPGMGKSTLAQRYIDNHPMALNLDIDNIWFMMGGWRTEPKADVLRFKYAHTIAAMHLLEGCDVIVPQIIETTERYEEFENLAVNHNAELHEILLRAPVENAIERFKARARAEGFADGFRPGGITDRGGREAFLAQRYNNVLAAAATRPNIVVIESIEGDIADAYQQLLSATE